MAMNKNAEGMYVYNTYSTNLALCALAEGLQVYCAHPEDDDVRLFEADEIEESEGHMFSITDGLRHE